MSATASKATSRNGHTADDVTFPLDSFRDAATHLRRPFTPAAVKFKVQATWPKSEPTGGLIVSYIDARLAVERLNLIVPHLWYDEYEPLGKSLICRLTVDGIRRQDIGDGTGKGLFSDALKRAAVKFGVGVSLYAIPQMRLNVKDGHLKTVQTRDGMGLALTPNGESHVRKLYEGWLDLRGRQAFGEPLDHGDSDDAQGDAEVDAGDLPAVAPPVVAPAVEMATPADVAEMKAALAGLNNGKIRLVFGAVGLDASNGAVLEEVPRAKVAALVQKAGTVER